ncbi:hypothetical protein A3A49_00740 [Candidatus Curtissbacteria bacterium RIFCSPLOWO2_01_FULL_38_11b]|uniref:Uncharacterized protein n=1 Tax=Candidatus Curtissbacteria bacterium RIFCSPLOWO2_01_FULL_38_11b TaxID=1797725 RepID=A0A1F5H1U3_9BACT|nr:MAG: hypothetical protein A3A49_00740 [Candidatus Curtissbacteria bacterium RIFCSPLOWO2_01_FULL_38_11b]
MKEISLKPMGIILRLVSSIFVGGLGAFALAWWGCRQDQFNPACGVTLFFYAPILIIVFFIVLLFLPKSIVQGMFWKITLLIFVVFLLLLFFLYVMP